MRLSIIILLFVPLTLSGQRYISGRITDAADGEPVTGASVFISGTTVGSTTDLEGNYRLQIPGEGSYRLTVSHVGYQSVFWDIASENKSLVFNTALETNELSEVTVSVRNKARQRDVNLFWKTILGNSMTKRTIQPLNPKDVYFYYNSETRNLRVTCRVPLIINNYEAGYQIRLQLEYFMHDYNTNITSWKTEYLFTELEPENNRQRTNWEMNRQRIYRVSLDNFIKSMFTNTYDDWYRDYKVYGRINTGLAAKYHIYDFMRSGFLLTDSQLADSLESALYELPETFLSVDSNDGSKILYIPPEKNLVLVCYGRPITENDLTSLKSSRYSQKLFVSDRLREPGYIPKQTAFKHGVLRHRIYTPEPVRIFPDGTYTNAIYLSPVFLSNDITGLNMKLPLEYIPDVNSGPIPSVYETDVATLLEECFSNQLLLFPQEKIYLHTDKPYYITGEQIWFRAYTAEAASHYPSFMSSHVYTELLNPLGAVVSRVKTGKDSIGAYHGNMLIPTGIPEGDYSLHAYSSLMFNEDEKHFFTKILRIGESQTRTISVDAKFAFQAKNRVNAELRFSRINQPGATVPQSVKVALNEGQFMELEIDDDGVAGVSFDLPITSRNRTMLLEMVAVNSPPFRQFVRIPLPEDDFDVSFYPEGGNLIQGTTGRVAFKAMKSNGQSINISGVVYDQTGTEISKISTDHHGMGSFQLFTERGKRYYAVIENHSGQSRHFNLPAAIARGYSLCVNNADSDTMYVSVLKPKGIVSNSDFYLLAHTRGIVHFVYQYDFDNDVLFFSKEDFPSGVLHLILFDAGMNPLSERLVFINNNDQAQATVHPDQETYSVRSLVKNLVTITDEVGFPLTGNFSVSVTSDKEVAPDTTTSILAHLLLTSDLHGFIENPAYYFQNNYSSALALDLLMMTQGWRRYNVADLTQGRYSKPASSQITGVEISGSVRNLQQGRFFTNRRANENLYKGIEITSLSMNGDYFDNTQTDERGRFNMRNVDLPDSMLLVVSALPKSGMERIELLLDAQKFPAITLPVAPHAGIDRMKFAQYADKAEQQYIYEHGIRMEYLQEVIISANRIPPRKSVLYSTPTSTLSEEEIDRYANSNDVGVLLGMISGVRVDRNEGRISGVSIRGMGNLLTGKPIPPLLLINDIPRDFDMINFISVREIAQIDILKDAQVAAFGMKGANGVIAIHTKRGVINNYTPELFHIKTLMPLGYQQPVQFYAPKYDIPERERAQTPDLRTTIHWQPVIRTDRNGVASFQFYTSDFKTTYSAVIEGITSDGRMVRQVEKIRVE